jgi:hypothetical protein
MDGEQSVCHRKEVKYLGDQNVIEWIEGSEMEKNMMNLKSMMGVWLVIEWDRVAQGGTGHAHGEGGKVTLKNGGREG